MKAADRLPLRLRLTLVFTGALTLVLAATGAFLYLRLAATLDRAVDDSLRARAAETAARLGRGDLDLSTLDPGRDGLVQILDAEGAVLASTPVIPASDDAFRVRTTTVDISGKRYTIMVRGSLEPRDEALEGLLTQLLVVGPIALATTALAGYLLAAAALRPVDAMSRQARAISGIEPGRRLTVPPAGDEVARLAETLNEMLGRLEEALTRERRFVAEASHELRTPLALLRTEVELALGRARTPDELERALRSVGEETDRLCRLAEDLLVLARSHSGGLPLRRESLSVKDLLETIGQRFAPRAASTGRSLTVEAGQDVTLFADRLRVEQAIGNLVDNALCHGGGEIRLAATVEDGYVIVRVRDNGRDSGRSPSPGPGLGLSIVDVIARAHGGAAALVRDGGATTASLTLPDAGHSGSTQ